jgi:hypothetical protein
LNTDLLGLAFSGGGIRSATFNLGILQGLADLNLLTHVDLLSTVSGGGYIGAWLTGWCRRLVGGIRSVQARLSPRQMPQPDIPAKRPIRFLREYSNYLTPKKGFFSADTWTMIAIWMRNTILNHLVLLVTLAAVMLAPRVVFSFIEKAWHRSPDGTWLFAGALISLTFAVVLIGLNLWAFDPVWRRRFDRPLSARGPSRFFRHLPARLTQQGWVQFGIVIPILVSAGFAAILLSSWLSGLAPLESLGMNVLAPLRWWSARWPEMVSAQPEERARWIAAGFTSGVFFIGLCLMSAVGRLGRCFLTTFKIQPFFNMPGSYWHSELST